MSKVVCDVCRKELKKRHAEKIASKAFVCEECILTVGGEKFLPKKLNKMTVEDFKSILERLSKCKYIHRNNIGDVLEVYENYLILRRAGKINYLQGLKGEKRIQFRDLTSIELRPPGKITSGAIQFSLAGSTQTTGLLNSASDENSILINDLNSAKEIVDYIQNRREEILSGESGNKTQISPADGLKKYKELLDIDAITKEEFDKKKQELLNL